MNSVIKQMVLAAGLLLAPSVMAQDKAGKEQHTPEERAAKHTEHMTKELGLSADQTAKVADINQRYATALGEVKESTAERDAKREQAKGMRDRRDQELKQVLTAEQYAKMLELRKQKQGEMKARHKGTGGSPEARPHNE